MIYNVREYDYHHFDDYRTIKNKRGNTGTRTRRRYLDLVCAFDIETTNDDSIEQAYMYIWQFQIEDCTIYGRTWQQFLDFLSHFAGVMAFAVEPDEGKCHLLWSFLCMERID